MKYAITYDIFTEDDIEAGEASDIGFISDNETKLSTAIDLLFSTRTNEVAGIECRQGEFHNGRLTFYIHNTPEYITGDTESRCLHIHGIKKTSADRILNILKNY